MKKSEASVKYIERRTFIKGTFSGKYIGHLAHGSSYHQDVNIYDLEVTQGRMVTEMKPENIRKWKEGEHESYLNIDTFKCSFPNEVPCIIHYADGVTKEFLIQLQSPKIHQPALSNQVYDGKEVFGDIQGEISGYISHWVPVDVDSEDVILPLKEKETEGNYIRYKNINVDGSTTFSDWRYLEGDSGGCLNSVFGVIGWIFVLLALLLVGWKVILPLIMLAGFALIYYLFFTVIFWLLRWLIRPLVLLLVLFAMFSLYGIFTSHSSRIKQETKSVVHPDETSKIVVDNILTSDSLIVHHRIWEDMDSHIYAEDIIIQKSDLTLASTNHASIPVSGFDMDGYRNFMIQLKDFDRNRMPYVYEMLDCVQESVAYDSTQFVKAVVALVQDIPYTLILHNTCNAALYKDKFISQYLNAGRECVGNVPFGLYSPVEFMGTLKGDCDTRSLFLYVVLSHYGYDVALLASEIYQHSLIGINMDLPGIYKMENNKKYVLWETTAPGIPYGVLDREISEMKYWNIILSSKN